MTMASIATVSVAQNAKNISYFCNSEAGGGVFFNSSLGKWEGSKFNPRPAFVLRLRFLQRSQTDDAVGDRSASVYEVSRTEVGTSVAEPCVGDVGQEVTVRDEPRSRFVRCESFSGRLVLNLNTNRFLEAYLYGFIDGVDKSGNTPFVSAGSCTKTE
jgi:hypothetical protein